MIKKIIFLIIIIFGLSNCGYSPIFLDNNSKNFSIVDFEKEGNEKINNIIENKLKKYLNSNDEKKYKVKIKTGYQKISAAKDTTGNVTNFKLTITLRSDLVDLSAKEAGEIKTISFSESTVINKSQNNYEQNTYEKFVIKNMSELLANKLITYLSRN